MFRQRTSSQKPDDELLATFRQQFPGISTAGPTSTTAAPRPPSVVNNPALGSLAPVPDRNQNASQDAFRDEDPTPRASGAEWRFTPSLLDHTFSFNNFSNQQPGYYTPTPGGTNTIYHPQAGDLHTPSLAFGMGLNTPLSLPTSDGSMHAAHGIMDMSHFPSAMAPQQYHQPFNAFMHPTHQQPLFPPSTFVHQDTGYETMDHDGSPLSSGTSVAHMGSLDAAFNSQSPPASGFQHGQFGVTHTHALPPSAHNFRFQSTLQAPTAMIKHADEIPVTYLNKGQAYTLTVIDSNLASKPAPGVKYRTFVRISFEDGQQREKPGVFWSLWKEGRGTNEAHQRGGKLQAVEFVETAQPGGNHDKRTRVELESSSFDGFSVTWTPDSTNGAECNIGVRFNFLSTDFSHSKGVKGIPVRLCAKTSIISATGASPPPDPVFEICYCKVKLFRDHGAERKLANDKAHVVKLVERLTQQIAQAESGGKEFGKRKRGSAHTKTHDTQRPGKAPKHKRTWSISSASSADGNGSGNTQSSVEDDLNVKLRTFQAMFGSTQKMSILYLRGEDLDDPDTFPVSLPGELAESSREDSKDNATWQSEGGVNSEAESFPASPSVSSMSIHSQAAGPTPWMERRPVAESRRLSEQPIKVAKTDDGGKLSSWIEAVGVDPSYKPPIEKPPKPVACFYVARGQAPRPGERKIYKAVYLSERSLSHFVSRITAKWDLHQNITRVIRVLESGLEVQMDDDVIRELSEGKDMVFEIAKVDANSRQDAAEWEMMAVDAPDGDGNSAHDTHRPTVGHELRFSF